MARVSTDSYYAARVFHDSIQTGNVSVFDCSAFGYATARPFESADDVLVDNAIMAVSLLDDACRALTDLAAQAWNTGFLGTWHLCCVTYDEVKEEMDMLDEWLTEEPEA